MIAHIIYSTTVYICLFKDFSHVIAIGNTNLTQCPGCSWCLCGNINVLICVRLIFIRQASSISKVYNFPSGCVALSQLLSDAREYVYSN